MMARRVILGATVLALAASVAVYPWLPARVPIHFDLAGRADGFAPRAVGAFLLPGTMLVMLAIARARAGATAFVLSLVTAFFAGLHVLVLRAALGDGTLGSAMWILSGAFFVVLGLVMPRVRRNRWVGVRTPWAMRSPEVWARTQRVGGYAFLASGLVVLATAGDNGVAGSMLRLVAIFAAGLVPVVYSWRIAS